MPRGETCGCKKGIRSRGNKKPFLQREACPKCQAAAETLTWFYCRSPKETWPALCGVAGWMAVCDRCHVQVNFLSEVMS